MRRKEDEKRWRKVNRIGLAYGSSSTTPRRDDFSITIFDDREKEKGVWESEKVTSSKAEMEVNGISQP